MTLMSTARILVADDFDDWRVEIRSILQARPDWRVIGEACDGLQAVQKTVELRPDVVLLDIGMPILNGIEAAQRIRKSCPDSRIVFVTENNDREVEIAALASGAEGYVLKSCAATKLLPTIETALRHSHHKKWVHAD